LLISLWPFFRKTIFYQSINFVDSLGLGVRRERHELRFQNNITVLAVDDDHGMLDIIEAALAPFGCRMHRAANGKEALAIAEQTESIDVLLTDVLMPEMNGIELAGTFMARYPETPILFMSGYICPSLGRLDPLEVERTFLRKPFTTQTLVSKLRDVLGRRA
jgi:two-component system cell cycle sensor histidine kinase/response regulator CckA